VTGFRPPSEPDAPLGAVDWEVVETNSATGARRAVAIVRRPGDQSRGGLSDNECATHLPSEAHQGEGQVLSQVPISGGACVVHAVEAGRMYGLERMLLALLPKLRERGVDARLLALNAPADPGAALCERLSEEGVPVVLAGSGRRLATRSLYRAWVTLSRWQPAIVHTHGYKAAIVVGAMALVQGRHTIKTQHTEALKHPRLAKQLRIEARLTTRYDRLVAVSERIRAELLARGFAEDRIRVVPNGIRRPAIASRKVRPHSASVRLLYLGRLVPGKDVHLLIEAVRRLTQEGHALELVVAGDGPRRVELEQQAAAGGLGPGIVRFPGFVERPEDLLAEADIFVLPSQYEGLPISILEAMAFGLPIIASRVGGVPSVVRDGKEALLITAGSQDGLEEALRKLLVSTSLRVGMGRCAQERFEAAWTADVMADAYAALYGEVMAGTAGGALARHTGQHHG
jgi:glycosyltransferase involved in cell wall biosynthesis